MRQKELSWGVQVAGGECIRVCRIHESGECGMSGKGPGGLLTNSDENNHPAVDDHQSLFVFQTKRL